MYYRFLLPVILLGGLCFFFTSCQPTEQKPRKIELLFLGHQSQHHNSNAYATILASSLSKKGINISYTHDPNDLNKENLDKFDALILYANHDSISDSQEKALLNYVRGGKGFLPVHCASFSFRN